MASAGAGYLVQRRRGLLTVVERVEQVHPHNTQSCTDTEADSRHTATVDTR